MKRSLFALTCLLAFSASAIAQEKCVSLGKNFPGSLARPTDEVAVRADGMNLTFSNTTGNYAYCVYDKELLQHGRIVPVFVWLKPGASSGRTENTIASKPHCFALNQPPCETHLWG